jgi:hypothetical protein
LRLYPQVPAREHTRRRVDVRLGVVADADGKQLHDFTTEVLLRLRLGVGLTIQPDDHRGVPGHLQEQVPVVAERVLAKEFDLSLRPA